MSILKDSFKAVQTTYEFSLDQMKMLIALDLGVASDNVTVDCVIEVGVCLSMSILESI